MPEETLITHPPFRAPHHTASSAAIIGGGAKPRPGEITLAHNGTLFLDEFPEFDRRVLEALREPLEENSISVSRSRGFVRFPARFLLVIALNPCPCGHFGSENEQCRCAPHEIHRYQRKMSGPLIDRIDIWSPVEAVPHKKLAVRDHGAETSETVRKRVQRARAIQQKRFSRHPSITQNSDAGIKDLESFCALSPQGRATLLASSEKMNLSARSYHRIMKVARTIADLENSDATEAPHVLEALQYRPKEELFSTY